MLITRLCLFERGFEDKFINELKNVFADFYPDGNEDDYTSMVNDHHFNRMRSTT